MSDIYLSRLFYGSTATDQYSPLEIGNILESCRRNNPALDITGMLFFGSGYFLQCLEGPRSNINLLYKKIMVDPRHNDVQILEFKEVGHRYFGEWTMKYVRSATVISKILKETGAKDFNPYLLDNYALNAMAEAFRDHHESDAAPTAVPEVGVAKKKSNFDILNMFKRS